ncbi:MAG TPA: nucleotide exchange factor GrpE [Phaeodactylibacter sp.]|nr:nucleotide exchange factor GrpE [Phaeodactylibacter sp.]
MTTDKKEALREEEQEQQSVESAAQEETLPTEDAPSKEGGSKKDKVSKLKKKNEELQQEVEELKDKYLRLFAEFDNYKKRMLREKMELLETASKDTIKALLPVLDDFDRAKAAAGEENSKEPFSEGVELVYQKLHTILQQLGLEPMESTGKDFDPDHHEAIAEVPAPSEELKGKVVDTVEKGYKLKDQIIRHAKVVVGK